jgi:membrane fusion protein (multidrug efflux system)
MGKAMSETKTEKKGPASPPTNHRRNGGTAGAPAADKKKKDHAQSDGAAHDHEKKAGKPFKWTPLKVTGLVLMAVILVVPGTLYYIYASHHATTDDAYTTGHIHNISSRVNGTVLAVLVDDNEFVRQGKILVRLDPRDYEVKVDQARANYLKTKANDERILVVKGDGSISKQEYDQSQASLLVDESTLADASNQLSYCTIYAPTDGYIGSKTVEIGNRIDVGGQLMDVVQGTWVVANYKETQLGPMLPGQRVAIVVDAIPGHTFYGWVDSFSPGSGTIFALLPSDNATGNFTKIVQRVPVKVVFDPASAVGYESRLVAGLSVELSVDLKSVPKGEALPQNQQIQKDEQSHLEANAVGP